MIDSFRLDPLVAQDFADHQQALEVRVGVGVGQMAVLARRVLENRRGVGVGDADDERLA